MICSFYNNCRFHKGEESFNDVHDRIKRGDIIGVNGYPARSKTGELSIIPFEVQSTFVLVSLAYFCFIFARSFQAKFENYHNYRRFNHFEILSSS